MFLFVERRCRQKPVWGHLRPLWLGKGSDLCLSLWTHSFAPSSISPVGAFPRKKDGWPSGKRVMIDFVGITKRQHTPKIAAQKKDGTITGVP